MYNVMKIKIGTFEFVNYVQFFKETATPPFSHVFQKRVSAIPTLLSKQIALNRTMYAKGFNKTDLYTVYVEAKKDSKLDEALVQFTRELVARKVVVTQETKLRGKEGVAVVGKSVQGEKVIVQEESFSGRVESYMRSKLISFIERDNK